jgi:aldose 1-epimerase
MPQITDFGTTSLGQKVEKITLAAGDLEVSILTWGAVLQSARLAGISHNLTLGSDHLSDYEGDLRYHGSIIGPVVNRLTNASAQIGAKRHQFDVNFNGRHTLHSGSAGTQTKVWQLVSASQSAAVLAVDLPDGEGGFPGTRRIEAHFSVSAPATLNLSIVSVTDSDTLINVTNHSYWNLDGTNDFSKHALQIAADHYLPADHEFIATGEIRAVTPEMDFRSFKPLLPRSPDLDNCYVLGYERSTVRDVLWLKAKNCTMCVATTEPGVQVYDCRHAGYQGLAIETQGWPDAPNHPGFPPITLSPGDILRQETTFRFTRE